MGNLCKSNSNFCAWRINFKFGAVEFKLVLVDGASFSMDLP
jgi:hypothetical protein